MSMILEPPVLELFRRLLQARGRIVCAFLILAAVGIYGATKIPSDPAIERLIVPGDPVAQATLAYERVFPEGDQALIMLESADPLGSDALQSADRFERDLAKIPHVEPHSL